MSKQRGFSLVEGLLIVLIVSVIGFGGYTVWVNQQVDEAVNTNEISQKEVEGNKDTAEAKKGELEVGTFDGSTGTVQVRGYLYTTPVQEAWCENNCSEFNRTFFYITEARNEKIFSFISIREGNSYVAEKSVSLGCLTDDGKIEADKSPSGVPVSLSLEESEKLVMSSETNTIDIELSRNSEPAGGPGFTCTSHFDTVKLL